MESDEWKELVRWPLPPTCNTSTIPYYETRIFEMLQYSKLNRTPLIAVNVAYTKDIDNEDRRWMVYDPFSKKKNKVIFDEKSVYVIHKGRNVIMRKIAPNQLSHFTEEPEAYGICRDHYEKDGISGCILKPVFNSNGDEFIPLEFPEALVRNVVHSNRIGMSMELLSGGIVTCAVKNGDYGESEYITRNPDLPGQLVLWSPRAKHIKYNCGVIARINFKNRPIVEGSKNEELYSVTEFWPGCIFVDRGLPEVWEFDNHDYHDNQISGLRKSLKINSAFVQTDVKLLRKWGGGDICYDYCDSIESSSNKVASSIAFSSNNLAVSVINKDGR